MKLTKKRKEKLEKVENRDYALDEAVEKVKETANANFDETIEAVANVNLSGTQSFRGTLSLPHTFGKPKRVLVFAKGQQADAAKEAGADFVGESDLVDKIKGGWLDFDVAIAAPDMMKDVGKLGPILGRRGLMPTPKNGTVTQDVATAVKAFKKGKIEYRANKAGVVQVPIGKASLDKGSIVENYKAFSSTLVKEKPQSVKGEFLKNFYISSTMGVGLRIIRKELIQ